MEFEEQKKKDERKHEERMLRIMMTVINHQSPMQCYLLNFTIAVPNNLRI